MATNMADLLFGRFLVCDIPLTCSWAFYYSQGSGRSQVQCPLFKGLSPEVISALGMKCQPMEVMQGSVIIAEGEPGKEM